MLKGTVYNSGNDNYKDFTFAAEEWSAPTMVEPDIIRAQMAKLKLEGRKIEKMKLVGHSYSHDRYWIEEYAYNALDQYDEDERHLRSEYNNISRELLFDRCVDIDEPFLIKFEDGDVFEIETTQVPLFRFSMNRIPWVIRAGTNLPNLDANIVFAPCIGRTIETVEIKTYFTDKDPMPFGDYIDESHSQYELVEAIVLWLDDGNGIRIEGIIDSCWISLINKERKPVTIAFRELKLGLYNWEDLHVDEETGFVADSATIFFGPKGAEEVDHPYFSLSPKGKRTYLSIGYADFDLLASAIIWQLNKSFDEYGSYEFVADQWEAIIEKAEYILSFETCDKFLGSLVNLADEIYNGKDELFAVLKCQTTKLWEHREKYISQIKDIKEWTSIVLSETDAMALYGF